LTQKWKVTVGEGVATPALVSDKLYVFSRQEGSEIVRCLDAATGKELWQEKYESLGASGPASGFSGPRSSPAVAEGKVVTLGVRGTLSCLDAATGKTIWRKDDFKGFWPGFYPSSSPIVLDGLCVAQLGGKENGDRNGKDNSALIAYDLATGKEKWKWTSDSPAYASPVLLTVGGIKLIVAQTESKMVAVGAVDGKLAWEAPAAPQGGGGGGGGGRGGGRDYKAATPIVDGQTIISAGRDLKAVKIEKAGEGFVGKELWSNAEKSVQFNTPVLKNGLLFGLTAGNEFFCVNTKDGQTVWSAPAAKAGEAQVGGGQGGAGGPGNPGGQGGRMRGGGGGTGFGSIVDAGSVLVALTPGSELIVFEPSDKAYTELARIKVADTPTHAHPVLSRNRIFIKDKESVTLWTLD
jgi:outer membrane protein assembly factor BamB